MFDPGRVEERSARNVSDSEVLLLGNAWHFDWLRRKLRLAFAPALSVLPLGYLAKRVYVAIVGESERVETPRLNLHDF